jgi:mannose-6-phosphate isomerase-like protein (cupin superfamily)
MPPRVIQGCDEEEDDMRLATIAAGVLMMVGQAGLRGSGDTRVTLIPAAQVADAFEKGRPLVETDLYKVHASRREGPGMAEVHVRDTDIIYVIEGSATIVTGGQLIDGHVTAANEIRGRAVTGGTQQRLTKGDVFIVPNGVPHWFTTVGAPLTYYVVKTTSPDADGGSR